MFFLIHEQKSQTTSAVYGVGILGRGAEHQMVSSGCHHGAFSDAIIQCLEILWLLGKWMYYECPADGSSSLSAFPHGLQALIDGRLCRHGSKRRAPKNN